MSPLETIERLCAVTELQAQIIKKQAEALAQAEIADTVAAELIGMVNTAAADLKRIHKEYN